MMHARGISRERLKALLVGKREKDSRHNQMDKNLSWDGSGRERTLGMPKCSGARTANRVVGSSEEVFTVDKNGW